VQKHAARRLHYDFRLEHDGVLLSWAVPQGPALDPATKRLAVRTEDHPVDYADFEGVIPAGNYGAGAVIVWDQGRFDAVEDLDAGLAKGKLLFELHGHKLRGRWTLVRTRRRDASSEEWLLIKKPDGWARTGGGDELPEVSVLSGLHVEELPHRKQKLDRLRAEVDDAPNRRLRAPDVKLMLAQTADEPFDGDAWWFELKYDGYRLLAEKDGDAIDLRYRRGKRVNDVFPDLVAALKRLPAEHVVLDGEVVVLDDEAKPKFQLLQRRVQLTRPADVERASRAFPVTYYAFDLLALDERDLRRLPLSRRKEVLEQLVPRLGPVRYADHVAARGRTFFAEVERRELEGLVAKRHASPYRPGRSRDWLKIPSRRRDDFVIVGFTPPKGSRAGFGGLHLAQGAGGQLVYAGRVGSGFDEAALEDLSRRLAALARPTPPLDAPKVPAGTRWVEPELVCEVRFLNRTEEGLLRQPVFLGLRLDESVDDVRGAPPPDAAPEPPPADAGAEPGVPPRVTVTNPDKVFFPESGFTKADLVEYYRAVSDQLLPLLDDRPVVLTRYPDGIEGKSFFQKNMPAHTPPWIRRETIWSEHAEREIDYLVLDSEEALAYAVNSASIPLHVWASRTATLQTPDWLVLDLDPKGAPFEHVVTLARAAHRLCDEIDLPSYCKTSGSTGLHVMVPLGRQLTFAQARQLAELLARVLVQRHPELATIDRMIQARKGKVYVDYVQNGHGRLLVSAFSVRPLPGAPVSTPLRWREVTARLDAKRFDLRSVPRRLASQKRDPWAGFLDARPDLLAALEALHDLQGGS
jgi:bifunctional non-homologous end joining protein LigD